ncbi:DUF1645 domain containing protein [Musa troglodytarum]|uniref:DUF1645 domain containing protein n=1 Tax=Musa troglodytarum TaxID=320322 RepID=A0A9E7L1P5_9LILI|nr:DUF1645 domain containing protein [Musa troglodytarum]
MTTALPEKPSLVASTSAAEEEEELAHDGSGSASAHQIGPPEASDKHAEDEDDDGSSEKFEFTFAVRNPDAETSVAADEIFSGGRIIPAYPLFDRDLLLPLSAAGEPAAAEGMAVQIPLRQLLIEEREAGFLSSAEPPTTEECRAPKPDPCKKSASTGSSLRWRLRDMMVGRSHSDGKEKFVFLDLKAARSAGGGKGGKNDGRVAATDAATAHRLYYGKGASERAARGPRRSFLPYRQELLGLFAPATGLRRSHHPF